MIIANIKRRENIAEYLLYMWQVEDIMRASGLDINVIDRDIISRYDLNDEQRAQERDWWESLIMMMKAEGVTQKGHLQINKNVLIRLTDLHNMLLGDPRFAQYTAQFYRTLPYIVELRAKVPAEQQAGELETCFNALYGVLLLKLQGREISADTQRAIEQISHFIGLLAAYFKKDEEEGINNEQ